ncbi:MAG: PCRF domain-containing protein, partial [Acidimicrobiia bacterium]|nr:PCRF domain-containing protein [Acidimicrobiia bacterium]
MPGGSFDLESKARELDSLRERAAAPDLWDDPSAATEVTKRLSRFERLLDQFQRLDRSIDDGELLLELAEEESDSDSVAEVVREIAEVDEELGKLEIES